MRVVIVTDAWEPQVNGVVRTLRSTAAELGKLGHEPILITPDRFRSIPCPGYPEIRLAMAGAAAVGRKIEAAVPNAIHIATEGPLGLAARRWCLARGLPFTTAYHTQFPAYLAKRTRLPERLFWPYIRRFHQASRRILVSTPTVAGLLHQQGLSHTRLWSRGVDLSCFRPDAPLHPAFVAVKRPVLLYVGRIATEKNIEAFLAVSHPGSKIVVGDGPDLAMLKRRCPEVAFLGALHGDALASAYASADVLVFPSRTDTFGLVMIEALACGTPVAAYPVPGPKDVVDATTGCLAPDLDTAIAGALELDRAACVEYGQRFSWEASARQFLAALAPLPKSVSTAARPKVRVAA